MEALFPRALGDFQLLFEGGDEIAAIVETGEFVPKRHGLKLFFEFYAMGNVVRVQDANAVAERISNHAPFALHVNKGSVRAADPEREKRELVGLKRFFKMLKKIRAVVA